MVNMSSVRCVDNRLSRSTIGEDIVDADPRFGVVSADSTRFANSLEANKFDSTNAQDDRLPV